MLEIKLILITLLCCAFLYVIVYAFTVWREVNKSSKYQEQEDAEIKALYDDYKENCR